MAVRDPVERYVSWYRHLGLMFNKNDTDTFQGLLNRGQAAVGAAGAANCDIAQLLTRNAAAVEKYESGNTPS